MNLRLTRTHRTTTALVAACAAALLAVVGLAGPAHAATISSGHWDVVAEVDCAAGTLELLAENHDTGATASLSGTTFAVAGTNSVPATTVDTGRFSSGPLRVLTQDEAQVVNGKLVLGVEAEYENCPTTPAVTFRVSRTASTVPTGGRAAAYLNTTGTGTQLDTASGSGRNTGVTITGHEDRRWGFATAGAYGVQLTARATLNGALRRTTDKVNVTVN